MDEPVPADKAAAHISEDGRIQTVAQHCANVAALAGNFADVFGMRDEAKQAGLMHDIGKTSARFQARISGNAPKCDHATAGAYELARAGDLAGSMCVAGHHSGLSDFGTKTDDGGTYQGRMNKAMSHNIPPYEAREEEIRSLGASWQITKNDSRQFGTAFRIRMLYSCLVDADFLDTETFMRSERTRQHIYSDMEELLRRFRAYAAKWGVSSGDAVSDDTGSRESLNGQDGLNAVRNGVLENCLRQGKHTSPGFYSLTVPTGGGKTTASLGFALEHARRNGQSRVIYVVPYTSIIEQNAEVFRDIVGAGNVLEHHSGYEGAADAQEFTREQLASENWDAPLIVTTAVRFFEALYASSPSRCRRLHNIANSVLIFDEAQLIPVEHLSPCAKAINELVEKFRCTALLCTATCPDLGRFFNKPIRELQPDPAGLYEKLRRVRLRKLDGVFTCGEIAEMMSRHDRILCVVNTRQAAKDVYDALPSEGRYHLSTLMHPTHRRKILEAVRNRLKAGETVRLVSTSLIEAGIDVDFPTVMREVCGLDSVLQAAGRCNREGRSDPESSVVYIFRRDGNIPSLLGRNIGAFNHVTDMTDGGYDTPEAVNKYFDSLYRLTGDENMDRDEAVYAFENAIPCPLPFRTVSECFHFISGETYTVYIRDDDSRGLIDEARYGRADRETYRKLGQYGVSLMKPQFDRYVQFGYIEIIGETTGMLVRKDLYDNATGLSLGAGGGEGIFA